MQIGFCRKVKKWFDGLDFGFSHLHDYLGLHDYPGLKSKLESVIRVSISYERNAITL